MNPTVKLGLALGIAVLTSAPALAQSNLPYQAGGAGMSFGYRQAILNDRLLGSRPSALVRGPSGDLLDVNRQGSQVFLRSPDSGVFLAGARPNRGWPTGLGTGLGWGGMALAATGGGYVGSWRTGDSLTQWIALLPASDGLSSWGGLTSGGGETPMDIWIRLL